MLPRKYTNKEPPSYRREVDFDYPFNEMMAKLVRRLCFFVFCLLLLLLGFFLFLLLFPFVFWFRFGLHFFHSFLGRIMPPVLITGIDVDIASTIHGYFLRFRYQWLALLQLHIHLSRHAPHRNDLDRPDTPPAGVRPC